MTEKEKAAAGLLYDPNHDRELRAELTYCKGLCAEYNALPPSDFEKRRILIRKLLGRTKGDFLIEQPFHCDYGYNIEIGENFYANLNLVILDTSKVIFGDNVFIAPNCGFYCAGHPLDIERRNKGLEYTRPITVGNNVWIGGNVGVMPGVAIGDGSVIAAGSIVIRDIPSGVVAAGNPCVVKRKITGQDALR